MHEFYVKIMKALAIPMKQVLPYSVKHFELLAIVLVAALAFAFLFAKTTVNRAGVVTVFGVLLLILEVMKQCLLTYVLGAYSWANFPWQLCIVPMYVCLIYPALKKRRETADVYLMSFGLLGALTMLIEPNCSLYPYLLLTIQSLASHGILLMISIYMMMSMSKGRNVRSFRRAGVLYLIGAAVALLIDFLTKGISNGTTNLFFIGPNDPHVKILQTIYYGNGWLVSTIVMILVTLAAAFVVYFVSGMGKKR